MLKCRNAVIMAMKQAKPQHSAAGISILHRQRDHEKRKVHACKSALNT